MPDNESVYPNLVRHLCQNLCAARDLENARQHTRLPRSCSTSMCCDRLRECPTTHAFTPILFDIDVHENARQHMRLPGSCSTSMCCERLRECPTTHAFAPILFDIYVLRQTLNTRQHTRLPRSCSTCRCYVRLRECPTTHAFAPILFDIYVLRETSRMPDNTRVCPDLVPRLCAARDLENARQHTRVPRSCSTCMCCERLRECPATHAFTSTLFDIYVLRQT